MAHPLTEMFERPTLVTVSFLAVVAVCVGILSLAATGDVSAATASLVVTTMLVLLTGFYAVVTYWMALETRKGREQEIRPVLDFHSREIHSEIANYGRGPARNLDITLELLPDGLSHQVTKRTLPAGESVSIPVEPFSSLRDRDFMSLQEEGLDAEIGVDEDYDEFWQEHEYPYDRLRMHGTFEDVWGNTHTVDREYTVWELVEGEGTISVTLDETESLHSIAMELQRIRGILDR